MTPSYRTAALGLASAVLLLGAALYQYRGYRLLFAPESAVDLKQRWLEQQYVFRGQNPFDLTYIYCKLGRPPLHERKVEPDWTIGVPDSGGYPPWAFVSGAALFWPGWEQSLWLYAVLSAVALAGTAVWAYRCGAPVAGRTGGLFLAAGAVAAAAYCTTLQVGQYTNLVIAALIGALVLCAGSPRQQWLGGLVLGIACLKPTISGPFLLAALIAGKYRAVAAALLYMGVASLVVWGQTATTPVEMLLQMLSASEGFIQDGQGLVGLLVSSGLNRGLVTPVLAAAVLLPAAALMWARRDRPLIELFAVAAVAGRLWTYHRNYDNLMLLFVLVPLGVRALQYAGDRLAAVAFLAVGVSLWAPAAVTEYPAFFAFQLCAWIGGAAVLVARPAADAPAAPVPEPALAPAATA